MDGLWFWNSVKITVGALLGELLVGMPAAWGFAKYDFPAKRSAEAAADHMRPLRGKMPVIPEHCEGDQGF